MNASIELDTLAYGGVSYVEGVANPPDADDTWPPLANIFPRMDCQDLRSLDFALLVTLRIKTMTLKLSYTSFVATTVSDDSGTVRITYVSGPSGSKSMDCTASLSNGLPVTQAQLLGEFLGKYGPSAATAPQPLGGGVYFLPAGGGFASYLPYIRPVLLINATAAPGGLPYVLTVDMNTYFSLPVNDGHGTMARIAASATGTALPTNTNENLKVIPWTFLAQPFAALTGSNVQPKDYDSGRSPGKNAVTTTYTSYQVTEVDVTATDYWSYDSDGT